MMNGHALPALEYKHAAEDIQEKKKKKKKKNVQTSFYSLSRRYVYRKPLTVCVWLLKYIWRADFKTSYIHSYMLLICRSGHSKEANFQHKSYCRWKILIIIEILNRWYQKIQILQL